MSVTVPTALVLKHSGASEYFSRGEVIETTDLGVAIKAVNHCYAHTNRRVLLGRSWVNGVVTTTAASPGPRVVVLEGWAQLGTDRDKLDIVARGTNVDVLVALYPEGGGAALGSTSFSGTGTLTDSITTGLSGGDSVYVQISLGHDGTSPATLTSIRLLERALLNSDLP